jgi:hypothetical protein
MTQALKVAILYDVTTIHLISKNEMSSAVFGGSTLEEVKISNSFWVS